MIFWFFILTILGFWVWCQVMWGPFHSVRCCDSRPRRMLRERPGAHPYREGPGPSVWLEGGPRGLSCARKIGHRGLCTARSGDWKYYWTGIDWDGQMVLDDGARPVPFNPYRLRVETGPSGIVTASGCEHAPPRSRRRWWGFLASLGYK